LFSVCGVFLPAEYSGFWSRCFGEGSGGDWRSVSLSEWEADFEAGGFGSKRGAQWQDFGGRGAGYFQEREADLRYALYQAAFIASTKNQGFMVYYTHKLRGREREPGIKTKMRVKLAAKLLIMAWTLMKKKEPFNPDYLKPE
jgi:hypothetical protein